MKWYIVKGYAADNTLLFCCGTNAPTPDVAKMYVAAELKKRPDTNADYNRAERIEAKIGRRRN